MTNINKILQEFDEIDFRVDINGKENEFIGQGIDELKKAYKSFITQQLQALLGEVVEELDGEKKNDYDENGWCMNCNGHKDNEHHEGYCEIYNQALSLAIEKIKNLTK